jgi:hypothetical protein
MKELCTGVWQDKLILNEEEEEIVEQNIINSKFEKYIDHRGGGSSYHEILIYETVFYFEKLGYQIASRRFKRGADVALKLNDEIFEVECGQTKIGRYGNPHSSNLIHVGYSRNILIIKKEAKLELLRCSYTYEKSKRDYESIQLTTENLNTGFGFQPLESSVIGYDYQI